MAEPDRGHTIFWDPLDQTPTVLLKEGILRKNFPLKLVENSKRNKFIYRNEYTELRGSWKELSESSCSLSMELKNRYHSSIRVTRLKFPAENGLEMFLKGFDPQDISFLRNGYQSWSSARSYRPKEKPLRPWLQIASQLSSNMANLPSNIPGMFSSEMYTIITDRNGDDAFLVGQGEGFRQFFYIDFHLHKYTSHKSYFNLTYDFGRQLLKPGESISLDPIIFSRGHSLEIQENYWKHIQRKMRVRQFKEPITGYGTWYYYYEHITPEIILNNLEELKKHNIPLKLFQIDDGYQKHVGDWLDLLPAFKGRMKEMADAIKEAGYIPGLWIAPFVTNRRSRLARIHPDYILKNEYGRKITAGYAPNWEGYTFYGLDITNPRYEEYLRRVIRTIVHDWGFKFLKCDFLFAACLRSAVHYRFDLSRADILRRGMEIIREEAGKDALIEGCGMPLVPGVGTVDLMRIGPDTGPLWIKHTGKLLRTGAMMGVRNSIRNSFVRALMNNRLWVNDPDCLMLRKHKTKLTKYERHSHINALIIAGGSLLISDDVREFDNELWTAFSEISRMNADCFKGRCIPIDLMEQETPEVILNTAGYLGVFNMSSRIASKDIDTSLIRNIAGTGDRLVIKDVWSGETLSIKKDQNLVFKRMRPHSSRLFHIIGKN